MPPTSEPGRSASSRLLRVMFAFRTGHARLTLTGLARRMGLPQATVRRLAIEPVAACARPGARPRRLGWTPNIGVRAELGGRSFNDEPGSARTR